jgi:hypothetical protein
MIKKNPKKILSDIKPVGSKSARKIPEKKLEPLVRPTEPVKVKGASRSVKPIRRETSYDLPSPRKSIFWWAPSKKALVIFFIFLIFGLIVYTWFSASLTLIITPQKTAFDLDNGLVLTIKAEEYSKEIIKSGQGLSKNTQKYSSKSSGALVVFNNFSSASQVLVRRTRFRTPDGLVFRTTKRIEVPGIADGKPGSIEVEVEADEPGDKYNIGLTDFSIPGFEGSARFDKFYGRSKTEMTGGAIGEGKIVGEKEASDLLSQLSSDIQDEYASLLGNSIPNNYMRFPSIFELTMEKQTVIPEPGQPGDTFKAEIVAQTRTLAIDNKEFENSLADALFKDADRRKIYRYDADSGINIIDIKSNFAEDSITLSAEGKARFVGDINLGELRNKVLVADDASSLDDIFAGYQGIVKVEKTFKPAILKRIPWRESRLSIEVK